MTLPTTQIHDSTVNLIGRDQYTFNIVFPQDREPEPASPRSINDSPIGHLSVHFTGRQNEMDFLQNALSNVQNDIPGCCAVYGMPGVGKSLLVLHYAKVCFDRGQYSYIFWVSATSVDKLNDGLSKVLDLICHPDRYLPDQYAKLTAARLWLENAHEDWLLIFDNVDRSSVDFFRAHLPRRNGRGHIIYTTRTEDVAESLVTLEGNQRSMFQLYPLECRDSANLLLQDAGVDMRTVTPSEVARAEQLVECVGRLPLAVVQAASFMRKTHTTLHEMYDLYMGNEKIDIVEWENDLTPYQERSVATTFTKQFDQLQKESIDISNLFRILSFLDPEIITISMITKGAKEWLHPHKPLEAVRSQPEHDSDIFAEFRSLVSLLSSTTKFRTAVQKLQALSLVEYRSTAQSPSLWMHDLIRFLRHEGAKKEDTYREWLQSSISLVCGALRHIRDPQSTECWAECEEFMPHLRSLNRWSNEYGVNLELIDANAQIGLYLAGRGRYDDAELLLKQVLEAYETKFGCKNVFTLSSVNDLARIYRLQGRYEEAETLFKCALSGREDHLGADHPDTLVSVNNLGLVYQSQGRYDEAEALFKRTLASYEDRLGADHPPTLMSVNNLGLVYLAQGRYDEAETLFKRALAGNEDHLGGDHPCTLISAHNLASAYHSQRRYDEAETLYKRAIPGLEKSIEAHHPFTQFATKSLADLYRLQGRCDEAESIIQSYSISTS